MKKKKKKVKNYLTSGQISILSKKAMLGCVELSTYLQPTG